MDDGFATQPGELTAAAARFDEAAGTVADALGALRTTLAALGDHLGTDEQGRAFAAQYDRAAIEGMAAIDREALTTRSLGDTLRATAHEYGTNDAGAADGLRPP